MLDNASFDPAVSVDFILDGEHVDPVAVKAALRCKGPGKVCLITDAVPGAGGVVFLQLWHCGRASHSDFHGGELPVAPSAIRLEGDGVHTPLGKKDHEVPRALETEELPGIVADYGGTIRQFEDEQWVMVVAYLGGSHSGGPASKVIVKAKKGDLDLYDFGKIDYDEHESRMVIEEQ